MKTIEYRVRPVTRYVVTRYHEEDNGCGSETRGEFDNEILAINAAEAFMRSDTHLAKPYDKVIFGDVWWTPEDGWSDNPAGITQQPKEEPNGNRNNFVRNS